MGEIDEKVTEAVDRAQQESGAGLNSVVAALVALLATFMALCNIKDGNVVQAMQQAQAKSIDTWALYQAKSTKQHLAESSRDQLLLQRAMAPSLPAEARALLEKEIATYGEKVERYGREKEEIRKEAEALGKDYDRLNFHDDQFDMAEAGLSVSIALLGIAALTRKRWLVGVAVAFATFGTVLGLAGFLGWAIHPEAIAKFLS